MVQRLEKLSEGKSKILYATEDPTVVLQYFKDDATAFNGVKKGVIVDKGVFNCQISARIFRLLEEKGVRTHYLGLQSEREMLVRKVKIVPLEVVMRNRAAGSFAKRFGVEEGPALKHPLQEFFLKDDALGDPLVNHNHIRLFGWADDETVDELAALGHRVNDILVEFFAGLGISLVDFKLEFGRAEPGGPLLLADEISPDGCRLWDLQTEEKLDKDRFRRDLGKVEESYARVANLVEQAISL